jgi:ribosomal protein S18 acetylase RimI-like enzyme
VSRAHLSPRGGDTLTHPLTVEPARPEEQAAAFHLVFRHLPPEGREGRVANALRLLGSGEFDPAGVLVARAGGALLGAVVCLLVPGANGLVWPPQADAGPRREEVEDELLRHAVAWLRGRGAKLGQALLAPAEAPLAPPLERHGFAHVTSLWYMRHDLKLPYTLVRAPERLVYRPYREGDADVFHRTLLRSYEDTLDCPEVNGVRTLEETLQGHREQGEYDPGRWWLALDGDRPVGVLLLSAVPEGEAWDVAYVGVVPEARRHSWGREMMHKALRAAHASDATHLTLSVDARNRPAWKLYLDLGFEAYDCREVYLAIWCPPPDVPPSSG